MSLAHQAYKELYNKEPTKELSLSYSGHFSAFNANVQYTKTFMKFRLSTQWKTISEEIQKGLIQSLLSRIKPVQQTTTNMDLYEKFHKNLSKYTPSIQSDPELEESFNSINEQYFHGMLDKPNLVWGQPSTGKLGSYEYATNTITISSIFKNQPQLLNYVMYHELLHKKHQYITKGGRTHSHTTAFRQEEKKYKTQDIEQQLSTFLAKHKIKKFLKFW